MLKEVKNRCDHYFVDDFGRKQGKEIRYYDYAGTTIESVRYFIDGAMDGPYIAYHRNGNVHCRSHFKNGVHHGEFIRLSVDGIVERHTYDYHGDEVHDFTVYPLCDEEKVLLVLKYGLPLLPLDITSEI